MFCLQFMRRVGIIIGYLLLVLMLLSFTSCAVMQNQNVNDQAAYGEKVQYSVNQDLHFPGFSLRYIGERKVENPKFIHGFLYYDFDVFTDMEKQTISWSAGTGDIAPLFFKLRNLDYVLEKGSSDIFGVLGQNVIVVWPKNQYEAEYEKLTSN